MILCWCCGYVLAYRCVVCCFHILFFSSHGLPLCGECVVYMNDSTGRLYPITCIHLLLDKMPHILDGVGVAFCLWILEGDGVVYCQLMETVGL
jgi:hypothetical protein